MEASTNASEIEFRRKAHFNKYFIQMDYITNCFSKDTIEAKADISKFINESHWSIQYKELTISNSYLPTHIESHHVPIQYLENYYQLIQEKEEAEAWIRMWANSVDSSEGFEEGLPGYDGNIKCPQAKEIHDKLKESPTFDSLLVRYGVYQLLEGK
jgi:hypothetical protein